MRLWHTSLIKVLPREQLVAQWREISACVGSIQKKGTPNHLLVNFIMDYDFDHLISYAYYVREEMTRRGYRTMNSVWDKIVALKPDYLIVPLNELYKGKMNSIYFDICWYNLYEKYLCGGIKDEDWVKIRMLKYKITKIIDAGLYTQDGKKVVDLTEVTLKGISESLVIKNGNK